MKPAAQSNIVLIGMPGSGKSTVGVILAKHASRDFVDTDILIQTSEQKSLQQIIDEEGTIALREVEEQILLSLSVRNHVIATGGSAAYSSAAMKHLKSDGIVVFLNVGLNDLQERISDFDTRGIARIPGQTFRDLYDERSVLYKKYADITIDCANKTQDQISGAICEELKLR